MKAAYAATFGKSKTAHAIKAPWPYGDEAFLTCGKTGGFSITYRPAGDLDITCKTCMRLMPAEVVPATVAMLPAADAPPKLRTTRNYVAEMPPPAPLLNARQRRLRKRNGSRFANA